MIILKYVCPFLNYIKLSSVRKCISFQTIFVADGSSFVSIFLQRFCSSGAILKLQLKAENLQRQRRAIFVARDDKSNTSS
jgi:hypothetical protein